MFAVIFEVSPKQEAREVYIGYAASLHSELEHIEGFLDNERFASLRRPGWLLSLSIWRDEKAVIRWRTAPAHHEIQQKGRSEIFRDYHLRVGQIIADDRLPADQSLIQPCLDTTGAVAKLVTLSEAVLEDLAPHPDPPTVAVRLGAAATKAHPGLIEWDVFESIYQPAKFILLTSWRDAAAPQGSPVASPDSIRHRQIRVIRDYGMFDRVEAPQYFPPAARIWG